MRIHESSISTVWSVQEIAPGLRLNVAEVRGGSPHFKLRKFLSDSHGVQKGIDTVSCRIWNVSKAIFILIQLIDEAFLSAFL